MIAPQRKIVGGVSVVALSCLATALACHAQAPKPSTGARPALRPISSPTSSPQAATAPQPSPASQAEIDAERAAIWNSADMLRARAWLQDYCNTSKKCKPGDAEKYTKELENMSPTQMKLWLMKFDEEEEQRQQQESFWKQVHSIDLRQAKSADKATQQSYKAIEKEETGAANEEQQQLNEQQQAEQNLEADKQAEGPYGAYGRGYYPGAGDGIHYHFHIGN